jgi:hypothetical protein
MSFDFSQQKSQQPQKWTCKNKHITYTLGRKQEVLALGLPQWTTIQGKILLKTK